MNLDELTKRALEIRRKYDSLNKEAGRRPWEVEEFTMGLAGDLGDLVKLVMAKENLRQLEYDHRAIGSELADCLWNILVIADKLGIDLQASFISTMDELDRRIAEERT